MRTFTTAHGKILPGRPPAPKAWPRTVFGKPPVAMTWHHIIPYSMLRDVWNTLANHQSENAKAKVSLHSYMRLLGFDHDAAKRLMQRMADGALAFEQQERIEIAVCYPKWDIVEGPQNRADDPEDTLDEFRIGLELTERERQQKLKSLYAAMLIFNHATAEQDHVEDAVFQALERHLAHIERKLHEHVRIIPFREKMWRQLDPPPVPAPWVKRT